MRNRTIGTTLTAASIVALCAGEAFAYGRPGHLDITDTAWHIMRASGSTVSSPPTGGATVNMRTAGQGFWLGSAPTSPDLRTPGPCANNTGLCGQTVSQAQWDVFLADIETARLVLNHFQSNVPSNATCLSSGTASETTLLRNFGDAVTATHYEVETTTCSKVSPYTPPGIFGRLGSSSFPNVRIPEDGPRTQGRVLGWHSKHRDDDLDETTINVVPDFTLTTTALQAGSEVYETVLGAVFVPFVCAYYAIRGMDDCENAARKLADESNVFDVLKAILPGFDLPQSEMYVGFWHFVNARDKSKLSNFWDDRQGLYYPEAGPEGVPGAVDQAITIATQLALTRLNYDESEGAKRYQIWPGVGSHQASDPRDWVDWEGDPIGTQQFWPLDNLAMYGEQRLWSDGQKVRFLGWPLHAIGDATVPHHVVGTTGYGHVPYEDYVDAHIAELLYRTTESNTTLRNQYSQAHRVLQIAFRWREYLKTHGTQDFITDLAIETLAVSGGDDRDKWPWCEMCTLFYYANKTQVDELIELSWGLPPIPSDVVFDPAGYYADYESQIRVNVERAMGAKIAYLVHAALRGSNTCVPVGRSCGAGCCPGTTCISGTCTVAGPI
jgi:hypothetical protein